MKGLKAEIKGNVLHISIPCDPQAKDISKSGKSRIVASTGGNIPTDLEVDGRTVSLGLNAYIKA